MSLLETSVASIPHSRGVKRKVTPGEGNQCTACKEAIRFSAKLLTHQIIANVYEDGMWRRVEHYHDNCYETVGLPYGYVRE